MTLRKAFLWHSISVCKQFIFYFMVTFGISTTYQHLFFSYFAGAGPGYIHRAICMDDSFHGEGGIGGVRKLVQLDSSEEMLHRDEDSPVEGAHRCDSYRMQADEEGKLPFPNGTFDLVLSSQSMHWVNDLPGLFKEVQVGWKVEM
jgi:SAM-dependent methyltransferase